MRDARLGVPTGMIPCIQRVQVQRPLIFGYYAQRAQSDVAGLGTTHDLFQLPHATQTFFLLRFVFRSSFPEIVISRDVAHLIIARFEVSKSVSYSRNVVRNITSTYEYCEYVGVSDSNAICFEPLCTQGIICMYITQAVDLNPETQNLSKFTQCGQ
jgi:hypothetical protein